MTKEEALHADDTTTFGFWVYLMTDCVLFASLFASYVVLRGNTFGGPGGAEIFSLPFVLIETLILLSSSFTCGLAILAAHSHKKTQVLGWLGLTFLLGLVFIGMEIGEFNNLVAEGHSWQGSAFLSAFFTLVGTHGLHIIVGLIWIVVMVGLILSRGLGRHVVRKLTLFSLFWHFLDIVWIFIFTIVYLMGAIGV